MKKTIWNLMYKLFETIENNHDYEKVKKIDNFINKNISKNWFKLFLLFFSLFLLFWAFITFISMILSFSINLILTKTTLVILLSILWFAFYKMQKEL